MADRIDDIHDDRLCDYRFLRERDLSGSRRTEGLFVGETLPILEAMLAVAGITRSVLTSDRLAPRVIAAVESSASPSVPVFVVDDALMRLTAGFDLHRGVLAIGLRAPLDSRDAHDAPFATGHLLIALDGVSNMDNVGAIFRGAAAFAVSGVILSRNSHDPLYRKVVRVSMGHALRVPYAWTDDLPATLLRLKAQRSELRVISAVCHGDAHDIAHFDGRAHNAPPTLLVVGGEYEGISPAVRAVSTACVRIPIASTVDSLNAAVAASICLHRLSNIA